MANELVLSMRSTPLLLLAVFDKHGKKKIRSRKTWICSKTKKCLLL